MSYAPLNYIWGAGWHKVDYRSRIGLNHRPKDKVRYWVQTLYTNEAHCLEIPSIYLDSRVRKGLTTWAVNRRDSSEDDHGETYPQAMDGPHIYQTLVVPPGLFTLSLYFFTRQDNVTSHRDYRLSVRPHPLGVALADSDSFSAQPELAYGRVRQCFGGVWKRFLVRGPLTLAVQVNRNNSWNTELDGMMLDLVDEEPPPYFQTVTQWEKTREALTVHPVRFQSGSSESGAANSLFNALAQVQVTNSAWYAANSRRFYGPLLNWYAAQAEQPSAQGNSRLQQRMATCYYQMGMYPQWEEAQKRAGLTSTREIEKALRWDGVTNTDSDYGVVTNFLISHPEIKTANNNAIDTSSRRNLEISQVTKRGKHIEH